MEKDHLEIILEDINHKFDLVLEGHSALDKKIDCKFGELKKEVEHNSFLIEALNMKVDAADEHLGGRIDEVEKRLGGRIDDVEKRLGGRIDEVEERLGGKIDGVAADLSAHRADTEAHHGVYRVKET